MQIAVHSFAHIDNFNWYTAAPAINYFTIRNTADGGRFGTYIPVNFAILFQRAIEAKSIPVRPKHIYQQEKRGRKIMVTDSTKNDPTTVDMMQILF